MSARKPRAARGGKRPTPKVETPKKTAAVSSGSDAQASKSPIPAEEAQPKAGQTDLPKSGNASSEQDKVKPKAGVVCEASGGAPNTPKDRFYSGLIAGIAVATIAAVVIGGISFEAYRERGGVGSAASQETSSGPLLGLNAQGRGRLSGWMIPTGAIAAAADDATTSPAPTVGSIAVDWLTSETSVTVAAETEIQVGRSARITREGKPWDPPGSKKNSVAWRFLNVLYSEDSTLSAEEHTMTVNVFKSREGLTADSIDIGPALPQTDEGDSVDPSLP